MTSQPIEVAGERLLALVEKALYWPERKVLFVADIHLGKAATFRALGVSVPSGTTASTLRALSCVLERVEVEHLVLLGDLWHAKEGRTPDVVAAFLAWRRQHASIRMTLIEGNHDLKAGRLPEGSDVSEAPNLILGPFDLRHHPQVSDEGYVLAGHIHPCVALHGRGMDSVRLPCFWFGERVGVLPAFGDFTGCAKVRPKRQDQVLAIADGKLLSLGAVV